MKRLNGMDAMLLYSETPNTVWSYVDRLGIAALTDDKTFNDPHEATDALSAAFAELRDAAGVSA